MLSFKKREDAIRNPIPPIGCLDYEASLKFWKSVVTLYGKEGWDKTVVLDWAIHTIINSLIADSASRIFLPKTETNSFAMDELFPFSAATPVTRIQVELNRTNLLAPLWNNQGIARMLYEASENEVETVTPGRPIGNYIKELNLSIVDTNSSAIHSCHFLGYGSAILNVYSLEDFAHILETDGKKWYIVDKDRVIQEEFPVEEPRMALLYSFALERHLGIPVEIEAEKKTK